MSQSTKLAERAGRWSGTSRLWLDPAAPALDSETRASIELAARGTFAMIRYDWTYEGEAQDGVLIVRLATEPGPIDMVWFDSWHTGGTFMSFCGEDRDEDGASALGSYPAPTGPDWGWRIEVPATTAEEVRILMYNITPEGEEAIAVDARYAPDADPAPAP